MTLANVIERIAIGRILSPGAHAAAAVRLVNDPATQAPAAKAKAKADGSWAPLTNLEHARIEKVISRLPTTRAAEVVQGIANGKSVTQIIASRPVILPTTTGDIVISRSEFNMLTARERGEFLKFGGKLRDDRPGEAAPVAVDGRVARGTFDKLSAKAKMDFVRNGGQLKD